MIEAMCLSSLFPRPLHWLCGCKAMLFAYASLEIIFNE